MSKYFSGWPLLLGQRLPALAAHEEDPHLLQLLAGGHIPRLLQQLLELTPQPGHRWRVRDESRTWSGHHHCFQEWWWLEKLFFIKHKIYKSWCITQPLDIGYLIFAIYQTKTRMGYLKSIQLYTTICYYKIKASTQLHLQPVEKVLKLKGFILGFLKECREEMLPVGHSSAEKESIN